MTSILASTLCAILYAASSVLLARRMLRGLAAAEQPKSGLLLFGLIGAALHGLLLATDIFRDTGINLGFFTAVSLITWLAALLVLLASLTRPLENLAIFIMPLAALAALIEAVFPGEHILATHGARELELHIIVSVLAYSLLSIGAVQALLLAIQDRHLHNKQPAGFVRALPPLRSMETLLFQIIGVGFVLLSVALLTGIIFLEDIFAQQLVHKTVLSIAAWGVFGILLWGRRMWGWRGRTAIRWTLAGFFTLLLAYLGSKLVLELVLGR